MIGFITDYNNDLTLNKWGDLCMESGIEAYRQHLINEIRLQQYEYPYNPEHGINYMGYILGQTGNLVAWESQVLDAVNAMSFVTKIVEWKTNIDGNNLLFQLVVDTDLGRIELKG